MAIHLPDPEMRGFLKKGNPDNVRAVLTPHVALGLEIVELDADACLMRLDATEVTVPTGQMLKKTVTMANALFGVVP